MSSREKCIPAGGDGALGAGEYALEALQVLGFGLAAHETGHGRLAESVERALELVVVAVVEKAQGASAAGGVVYDLGYDGVVLAEVEFVADADFSRGVYEHIPQAQFLIELAQEKHLDTRAGFLLVAVETGGEYLGVVENKDIVLVEVVEHFLEHLVLYLAGLAVEHHHAAFVAMGGGILGNLVLGKFEFELGEFHIACGCFGCSCIYK